MKLLACVAVLIGMVQSQAAVGAVLSAGYRGVGTHNNMGSKGAVVAVRPVPKLGLSYSFNYADVDAKKFAEDGVLMEDSFSSSNTTVDKATLNRQLHEAQLRWYPMGGSFFFGAGIAAGSYKGTYAEVNGSNAATERTYTGTTSYSSLNIGNVWEFKHFMLGAEWLGVARNMSHTRKIDNDASGQMSEQEKNYQDYVDLATKTPGFTALMVHAGLSL